MSFFFGLSMVFLLKIKIGLHLHKKDFHSSARNYSMAVWNGSTFSPCQATPRKKRRESCCEKPESSWSLPDDALRKHVNCAETRRSFKSWTRP